MMSFVSNKISYNYLLYIIIASAAFLRLSDLGTQGFWLDEIGQIGIAMHPLSDIATNIQYHLSPPLDYFITHLMLLISHSEFWLRIPAAISGILLVIVVYLIGKTAHDEKLGILASLLVAFSPVLYVYSQELRMYSLFCLLSATSVLVLMKVTNKLTWGLFILISLLGLYTHYFYFFVLFTELVLAVNYLPFRKKNISYVVTCFLICLIAFVPWLPYLIYQYNSLNAGNLDYALQPNLKYFTQVLGTFPAWWQLSFKYWYKIGLPHFYFFGLVVGLFFSFKKSTNDMKILALYFLLPLLSIFLFSFYKQIASARNMLFLMPIYYIIIAYGYLRLYDFISRHLLEKQKYVKPYFKYLIILLMIVGLACIPGFKNKFKQPKPEWKVVVDFIDKQTGIHEIVVDHPHTKTCLQFYYDFNNFGSYENKQLTGNKLIVPEQSKKKKDIRVIDSKEKWEKISKSNSLVITYFKGIPDNYKELFVSLKDKQQESRQLINIYQSKTSIFNEIGEVR